MKCWTPGSGAGYFAFVLFSLTIFTGISAELLAAGRATLLSDIYELNPDNIMQISYNLTSLIRWVTKTRPLGFPDRHLPDGENEMPLSWAIAGVYGHVKGLIDDLRDPNLWADDEKLEYYGFDRDSIAALSQIAPEYFEDRIAIANKYLDEIRRIPFWTTEIPPKFYYSYGGPRPHKAEVVRIWDIIYDFIEYIAVSRPAGPIKIYKVQSLVAYLINARGIRMPPGHEERFTFTTADLIVLEVGFDSIANAIDLFISDRDWFGIDSGYNLLTEEFVTTAPFWVALKRDHEHLRKFIADYMMLFWSLRIKLRTLRKALVPWMEESKSEFIWGEVDPKNPDYSVLMGLPPSAE
ncbi:hypothetical protein TWF730_008775 [Orbilia blumenaviensis]|uniref:Uncharacterized protein n=1 Tax=Orbilia blumenaviensis TaxID=1796055 RepID=A0AAV9V3C3_9PEZI